MQIDVDPWIVRVAVLFQQQPEVVAVIYPHRSSNGILDELDLVTQIHLGVPCSFGGLLDFGLLEEHSQSQLVRNVLLHLKQRYSAMLLDRTHRLDLERPGLIRQDTALSLWVTNVDLIR